MKRNLLPTDRNWRIKLTNENIKEVSEILKTEPIGAGWYIDQYIAFNHKETGKHAWTWWLTCPPEKSDTFYPEITLYTSPEIY